MERTKKEIDMDYEKKYKEALKDMRVIYPNLRGDAKLAAEHAFPELTESEDERIRKALIDEIKVWDEHYKLFKHVSKEKVLAYLEKQKEQPQVADASKMEQEVDLEKEIDKGIADYSFTKTIDSGGFKTTVIDYAKIARHFYELGLNARKEE